MKIKYGEMELDTVMTPNGYRFKVPDEEDWHDVAGDIRHLLKYVRHYMHIERHFPDAPPEVIG